MLTEGIGTTIAIPARAHEPARQVERGREERREAQTSSQQRHTQPEELLELSRHLEELRGNLVDTLS